MTAPDHSDIQRKDEYENSSPLLCAFMASESSKTAMARAPSAMMVCECSHPADRPIVPMPSRLASMRPRSPQWVLAGVGGVEGVV